MGATIESPNPLRESTSAITSDLVAEKLRIQRIWSATEHTALDQTARPSIELRDLVDQVTYGQSLFGVLPAGICVHSGDIPELSVAIGEMKVELIAVAGFPDGKSATVAKLKEAEAAYLAGATGVDIVMNVARFLNRDNWYVQEEISQFVELCASFRKSRPEVHTKVIIETSALKDPKLIERATELVADCGVDYVKSSTGRGEYGARVEDIREMKLALTSYPEIQIKAAGGIREIPQALALIEAGADRIGASGKFFQTLANRWQVINREIEDGQNVRS